MNRLLLLMLLIYNVSANDPCNVYSNKEMPDIRIIELGDSSNDYEETQIVALHLPDRRKRESDNQQSGSCKKDEDCGPGEVCITNVTCVKGVWRTVDYLKARRVM